jgi:hypothetical protein
VVRQLHSLRTGLGRLLSTGSAGVQRQRDATITSGRRRGLPVGRVCRRRQRVGTRLADVECRRRAPLVGASRARRRRRAAPPAHFAMSRSHARHRRRAVLRTVVLQFGVWRQVVDFNTYYVCLKTNQRSTPKSLQFFKIIER